MSQLVCALLFSFSLFSLSLLFFFFPCWMCVLSLPWPSPPSLPQISFLSFGSQRVHPPSFLSLLPSLRSQKNGWLSGMHSFAQSTPSSAPHCLCVCQLVHPAEKHKNTAVCSSLQVCMSDLHVCLRMATPWGVGGRMFSVATLVRVTHINCNVWVFVSNRGI